MRTGTAGRVFDPGHLANLPQVMVKVQDVVFHEVFEGGRRSGGHGTECDAVEVVRAVFPPPDVSRGR